jgi:Xaa-Pro aminopeptidase
MLRVSVPQSSLLENRQLRLGSRQITMLTTDQVHRGKYINIERIVKTIDNSEYDAVIINSPENIPYYSGFYNMDLRSIPERVNFVVWPKAGEPAFVVGERRAENLEPGETYLTDIVTYHGEGYDSTRAVADVLAKRGITSGKVGIEGRTFPGGHLLDLQRRLPEVEFADAYSLLESVRLVKTPAEIDLLVKVANLTTEAIDAAFADAKPGDTEKAVAARMQHEILARGADMITAPILASGSRSGYFHPLASEKVIEDGDVIKTDIGGFLEGYYSDIARTVVIGKASDYQRDVHAKLTEVKHRVVDYIKPGVLASEVANFARKSYADLGLEYRWALVGHSIGLGLHESPQIYPWIDEPILENMVMMIEIGYTDYPRDSFSVEDMVVVTESGAEYRTDVSKHEKLWEVGA